MIQKKWQGCIGKVRFCSDASSFSLPFLPNVTFHKSLRQCNMKGLVHNHWTNTSRIWIHVLFRPRDSALRFSALIKMHYFTTLLRCDTIFQQFPNAMTGSKKVKFTVAQQRTTQCLKMLKKSHIQCCERSDLRLLFEWTKIH